MELDTDDGVKLNSIRRNPILAVCEIEKTQALQRHQFRYLDKCQGGTC